MFREKVFVGNTKAVKKIRIFFIFCSLLLVSSCYQRFEKFSIRSADEGITFSHPEMEAAIKQGNLCVFGEISVSRRDSADNLQEEMWSLQNTESGFQPNTEPMKKPYIVYGERLPQTQVLIEPKPLREGNYRVTGVVGIYNQKHELLKDLSFVNKFSLARDSSGKPITSSVPD